MESAYKPKSFWTKPEGVTGAVFLIAMIAGAGFLIFSFLPAIFGMVSSALGLAGLIAVLVVVIFMILESKTRALVSYM